MAGRDLRPARVFAAFDAKQPTQFTPHTGTARSHPLSIESQPCVSVAVLFSCTRISFRTSWWFTCIVI